jgi:PKD repeat protein
MKHLFALAVSLAVTVTTSFSQQRAGHQWCVTDEHTEELRVKYPEYQQQRLEMEEKIQRIIASGAAEKVSQTLRVIPVVVHVISDDGVGISKAQIESGLAVLNRDFHRLNADTVNTRPLFSGFGADFEIEFRLARLDPNGNCTEGIVRKASPLTNSANPRDLVKGVSYWPADQYLNVWIVNSIYTSNPQPGQYVAGYAQFPGTGPLATYGFVNRHDAWGTVGTAAGDDGRVATHEIGHLLNLYHTFQGGCGTSCNNSGDFVCDTPPAATSTFANGCNNTLNNCSNDTQGPSPYTSDVLNMTENYMSYDVCQNIYTQGQKARMNAAFLANSFLQNLTSPSNAVATGTNDGFVVVPCSPTASFKVNNPRICANSSVTFTDVSYNATVDSTWNWNWSFPGGTPSTSTLQNPSIVYSAPGTYNAVLTVSNSFGSDSIVRTSIVKVIAITGGEVAPFSEGFENPAFPSSGLGIAKDWEIMNTSSTGWNRSTAAAFQSTASMRINNLPIPAGTRNALISPTIDMSNMQTVALEFDLAYALRTATATDKLFIYTSTNCGQSWQLKYTKTGAQLQTNNGVNQTNFVPTNPNQWRHETVNLTGAAGQDNVLVKVEVESDAGNNLFIDNLQITGTVLSAQEQLNGQAVSIYPNPIVEESTVNFYLKSASRVSLQVQDMVGRTVASTTTANLAAGNQQLTLGKEVSQLPAGVYLLQLQQDQQVVTLRFVKR